MINLDEKFRARAEKVIAEVDIAIRLPENEIMEMIEEAYELGRTDGRKEIHG